METGPIAHKKNLTKNKLRWESMDEVLRKDFNPYVLNLFLSQDIDLIEFVNDLQHLTIGTLNSREVYKLYLGFLPTHDRYCKFIKSTNNEKYNKDLINYLVTYYNCSIREVEDYLNIYFNMENGQAKLKDILIKFGIEDKKINQMLKVKK